MKAYVKLMTKRTLLSTLLVTGSFYGGYVAADEKNFGVQTPSVNEFVDALAQPAEPQLRFRGIKRISAAVESTPESVAAQPEVSSVSMQLQFKFDSSRLTQSSKESLDNLSMALITDELQEFRFAISGYTDASGSDHYNQNLSERRAASVKNYLVYRHSIDENRLDVVGLGEKDLLDASNPNSEINRRVAIKNLGAIAVAAVSE